MSGKTYTPLRYPGGKTQVYEFVKELIKENNCHTYIEPYMGGAGVAMKLLLLGDVEKIIVNDYDKSIYAFWYSVLYLTEELIDKIENTNITIDEWKIQKSIQDDKENVSDILLLGFSTLFLNRTNRSGIIKAGVIGGKNQNGKYKLDCRFSKSDIINKILEISKHKKQIKLFNMDAEQFIKSIRTFMCNFINSGFRLISSIFFRSILFCIYRMFRFVLCGDICLFHFLTGNGCFIQGLYRTLNRISCFNISHIKPPS